MPSPVANVQQVITIEGVDNASAAVKKAKESLGGLEQQASATATAATANGEAVSRSSQLIQQTTQRAGGAMSAFAAALGPVGAQIAEVGRSATALGSTANVLPGPLGIAAAAVVGLAAGVKMLSDYMSQTAMKMQLLVGEDTRKLGEQLGADTQQTIALSQAMQSLGKDAIAPTSAMLKEVWKNAEAMGADPVENTKKFIEAWKEGPEAVEKVQQEIGRLSFSVKSLHDTWAGIGFSAEELGLASTVDYLTQAKNAGNDLAKAEADVVSAQREVDQIMRDGLSPRTKEAYDAAVKTLEVNTRTADVLRDRSKEYGAHLKALGDLKSFEDKRAAWAQNEDARAELATKKSVAYAMRVNTIETERRLLALQIEAIEAARLALGNAEADAKLRALNTESLNLDVKRKQLDEQRKADAKAAVQAAQQRADSISAAQLATQKAIAERDGVTTLQERLKLIQQERDIDIAKANRTKGGQRDAELTRIAAETETKVAAAKRDAAGELFKADQDVAAARTDLSKRTAQVEIDAARNAGDERLAVAREIAQADAEYTAQLAAAVAERDQLQNSEALTAEIKAARIAAATQKIAGIEAAYAAQKVANAKTLNELDKQATQKTLDQLSSAAQTVGKTTDVIGGKAGKVIGSLASSVSSVTKNWKSFAESGADAISSAGQVAAAFVDGEKQKAAILAIMETAAAVVAFTTQNYVAGAGHTAAALLYAGVAGGAIGNASAAGGGGGGGFAEAAMGSTGGASNSGKPSTVVVNFNQPLATKQEIGKAIAGAMRSLSGTGVPALKGA